MAIPCFPEFVPLERNLRDEIHPELVSAPDGVSEFTFADLYLFRRRYRYQVSRAGDALILSGLQPGLVSGDDGRRFFMTPAAAPSRETVERLFQTHEYWKNISDAVLAAGEGPGRFHAWGIALEEDRDNFDYLYLRTDLAELPGKKYHKKRNLIAQFLTAYPGGAESLPLTAATAPQALAVLDHWRAGRDTDGDYLAAREALGLLEELGLQGTVYLIDGRPAAFCLGEPVARGAFFDIHFEKAVDEYKGIYQYINQAFAASLPGTFTYINREQDLGDEGLRQAKMTYRPAGFVHKFTGRRV